MKLKFILDEMMICPGIHIYEDKGDIFWWYPFSVGCDL